MTTNTAPRVRRYNRWDLETLRAGKACRDEHGEVIEVLDAMLAAAEAQFAELSFDREVEPAAAPEATRRPGSGYGSTGGARNAATGPQLAYLAKLAEQLGEELATPRDKRHASDLIEAAKRKLATRPAAAPARTARPATEGQTAYLADLLATREHGLEVDLEAGVTFDAARALIDQLVSAPRVRNATAAHGIREGRYAYQPAEGAASFYRVSRTGRIYVQAGPAEHPYRGKLNEALTAIAADQKAAAALYGQLIGVCGRCGRDLTDEESRARGLGPVCADKGW